MCKNQLQNNLKSICCLPVGINLVEYNQNVSNFFVFPHDEYQADKCIHDYFRNPDSLVPPGGIPYLNFYDTIR